ncbi:MAG: hypothetical protein ACOCP4_01025 [Candidatus Woesearchaeota archaeon]
MYYNSTEFKKVYDEFVRMSKELPEKDFLDLIKNLINDYHFCEKCWYEIVYRGIDLEKSKPSEDPDEDYLPGIVILKKNYFDDAILELYTEKYEYISSCHRDFLVDVFPDDVYGRIMDVIEESENKHIKISIDKCEVIDESDSN